MLSIWRGWMAHVQEDNGDQFAQCNLGEQKDQ